MWSIVLPIVFYFTLGFPFGGAKPVPVNPYLLRNPSRDMMLVALAGPVSNLLLAALFIIVWKLMIFTGGMHADALPAVTMKLAVYLNIALAAFNMLPIPPLDGSRVLAYLLRGEALVAYERLESYGMWIIIGLLYFGGLGRFVGPAVARTWNFLFNATGGSWI
jgi:Zn-dependent protease